MIKVKEIQQENTLVYLVDCADGVYVKAERGECICTLAVITDEGLSLWPSIPESFGLPLDEEGRIKVTR